MSPTRVKTAYLTEARLIARLRKPVANFLKRRSADWCEDWQQLKRYKWQHDFSVSEYLDVTADGKLGRSMQSSGAPEVVVLEPASNATPVWSGLGCCRKYCSKESAASPDFDEIANSWSGLTPALKVAILAIVRAYGDGRLSKQAADPPQHFSVKQPASLPSVGGCARNKQQHKEKGN